MLQAVQLQRALGANGFVHVRVPGEGKIVKLMRIAGDKLAVKTPSGDFTEFSASAWAAVARHINKLFGLRAPPRPRLSFDERWEQTVERAKAARQKLDEFEDVLAWRGQYADGSDRVSFGAAHNVDRRGLKTLCGKDVPQHLFSYVDSGDTCRACDRVLKRLKHEAEEGGY